MAITGVSAISGMQILASGACSAKSAATASYTSGGNNLQNFYNHVNTASGSWTGASNPQIPVTGINGVKISESAGTVVFEVSGDYYPGDNPSGFITSLPSDITARNVSASEHLRAKSTTADLYGNFDYAGMYFRSGAARPYNIGIDNTGSNFYIATAKNGYERIYASSIKSWNSKGDMFESAFGYDANDKISGYNGSAFAGGTVATSAGIVGDGTSQNPIRTDETVLWSGTPTSAVTLSESMQNFDYLRLYFNLGANDRPNPVICCRYSPTMSVSWGQGFVNSFIVVAKISANPTKIVIPQTKQIALGSFDSTAAPALTASTGLFNNTLTKVVGVNRIGNA